MTPKPSTHPDIGSNATPSRSRRRPRRPRNRGAAPVQLSLFPERVALARIRPERNERRFYRLEVWPDLFGRPQLARIWGRIGTSSRLRVDPYPDLGSALDALADLARAKRRRGYRDQAALPW